VEEVVPLGELVPHVFEGSEECASHHCCQEREKHCNVDLVLSVFMKRWRKILSMWLRNFPAVFDNETSCRLCLIAPLSHAALCTVKRTQVS
jgi:hypothetical protein